MVSRKVTTLRHRLALMCLLTMLIAQVPALGALRRQNDSRQQLASAKAALDAAIQRDSTRPTKRNGEALDRAYATYNAAVDARRADIIARINEIGGLKAAYVAQGLSFEPLEQEHDELVAELNSLPSSLGGGGPVPPVIPEAEPNNTSGTANAVPLGPTNCAVVDGSISPAGDTDFFRITTTAANMRLWAYVDTGLPQSPLDSRDSQLRIFAADGATQLEFDDDDGTGNGGDGTVETGLASSVAGLPLAVAGNYFINVREFVDDDTISPYRLFIVVTDATNTPEAEPNDTTAQATVLTSVNAFPFLDVAGGAISAAGDVDIYSFQATAGNMLYLSLDNDPGRASNVDLDLALLDSAGTVLLETDSDSVSPFSEAFWWNVPTTGTYFARVRDIGGTATGDYALLVAACNAEGPPTSACTLTCPPNQNVPATSPSGAVVNYPPPTTSGTCGTVTCTPASGSTFPVGTTTVTCTEQAGTSSTTTVYSSGNISVPIPASGTSGSMTPQTINVSDTGTVTDVNVRVRLDHTWDADLNISLRGPNNVTIDLSSGNGGSADNYGSGANDCSGTKTVFDDEAATAITAASAPFAGSFRPEVPLSTFDGIPASGTWTLLIDDTAVGDTGTLGCWELEITRTTTTGGASCTFTVTVFIPFNICFVNESANLAERDVFRAVVGRPAGDPLQGYYEYYRVSTGERFTGFAETVNYRPGASLVMYDRDSPTNHLYVNANLAARGATVQFTDRTTGRVFTLRDTDTGDADTATSCANADNPPPAR